MAATLRNVLFLSAMFPRLSSLALSQEDAPDELWTPEQRRQHILQALVRYADLCDRAIAEMTTQGRDNEARTLHHHIAEVRMGWNTPLSIRSFEGLQMKGTLKQAVDGFEAERTAAEKACDTAIKEALDAGEFVKVQKLQHELRGLKTLDKNAFQFWSPEPDARDRLKFGRVTEMMPILAAPNDRRVPAELQVRFGPQRFQIKGTGQVDTARINGKEQGHFGKLVYFDRTITPQSPTLSGVLRVSEPWRKGHSNYMLAFLEGRRIRWSPTMNLESGGAYDWECQLREGKLTFELSRKGEQILKGGWPSSGSVKLGIAATVRYPGDRSMICVAFR